MANCHRCGKYTTTTAWGHECAECKAHYEAVLAQIRRDECMKNAAPEMFKALEKLLNPGTMSYLEYQQARVDAHALMAKLERPCAICQQDNEELIQCGQCGASICSLNCLTEHRKTCVIDEDAPSPCGKRKTDDEALGGGGPQRWDCPCGKGTTGDMKPCESCGAYGGRGGGMEFAGIIRPEPTPEQGAAECAECFACAPRRLSGEIPPYHPHCSCKITPEQEPDA